MARKFFSLHFLLTSSVLWRCSLGGMKGIRPVKKTEWWGAGVVICLKRGADLHTAQLMPLPLTVTCFSKIQIGFTRVVLDKRPLNGCACVITYLLTFFLSSLKRLWLADPCSDVRCAEGERCELDDVRHPVCRCSDDVTRCADVPYAHLVTSPRVAMTSPGARTSRMRRSVPVTGPPTLTTVS